MKIKVHTVPGIEAETFCSKPVIDGAILNHFIRIVTS
jgi:hypothetical protein